MITKEMTIGDVIRRFPATAKVFSRYGMDCNDCQIAEYEEVEHGAAVHKVDVAELLRELNSVIPC